ncbi:MAG: LysM domain-containing protein [Solirubrobacteraceae bacterium]|jgi:LysM repeat protein|nr:LysM domain-containing protein [Solirubrobacteraceae bacterium]
MPGATARRRPSRWLAPAAIVVCAGVVFVIARGGTAEDDGGSGGGSGTRTTTTETRPATTRTTTRKTYVVRSGDTLSAISIETGVPVSRLQALNPDLDVQALQPGQRLTLRR